MPNWCSNMLRVNGEKEKLESFRESFGKVFSLEVILPHPKELEGIKFGFATIDGQKVNCWREVEGKSIAVSEEEQAYLTEKHGETNLYNWCNSKWGTKWDVNNWDAFHPGFEWSEDEDGEEVLETSFDSAWSPPEAAVAVLAKKYPELWFELFFAEPGCCFFGIKSYSGEDSHYEELEELIRDARKISPWHEELLEVYADDDEDSGETEDSEE